MKEKRVQERGIFSELDISGYLSGVENYKLIESTVKETIESMENKPDDYRFHVDNVHKFMLALWTKYDCLEVFNILNSLTKIEPALLDMERDPEAGNVYRDHYVHLFHVFIFGLRIITAIRNKLGKKNACKILKVKDELLNKRIQGQEENGKPIMFRDYGWKERLFYLWTIISTLHDIAIPITHLNRIRDALNEFSNRFHLEISGPALIPSFPPDLDAYLDLLSRIFQGKLLSGKESWRYDKKNSDTYIKGYLERLFVAKDHGVLGGFLVYKKIEEIFLQGKSKYKLDPNSYQNYKEIVLEEDIARAALAISLHNLRYEDLESPRFMPLSFHDYPLCFLLILADSLQEYLRWEGRSIRGNAKLKAFPEIKVAIDNSHHIKIQCNLFVEESPQDQEYFRKAIEDMMKKKKKPSSGKTIAHAAKDLSTLLKEEIVQKLHINDYFSLSLSFYQGDKHLLCTQTFRT